MLRKLLAFRPAVVATSVAAVLALSLLSARPALAQAGKFQVELTKIELAEKRLTLKASMGELTLRVAPGVALDAFKPGDKVLITFGQDGTEPVITSIELVKS